MPAQLTQVINQDYKVGAPLLNDLNNFHASNFSMQNRVAFYGVESKADLLWREISSFIASKPEDQPAFQADNDQDFVDGKNDFLNRYAMKRDENRNQANWLQLRYGVPCGEWGWIFNFVNCLNYDDDYWRLHNKANAYAQGIPYINGLNDKFKNLIGAYKNITEPTLLYECFCQENDYDGNVTSEYYTYAENCAALGNGMTGGCNETSADPIVSEVLVGVVELDSDALVTVESQIAFPGADIRKMDGSNHQQMRNDSNTKAALNALYDGDIQQYFFTSKK